MRRVGIVLGFLGGITGGVFGYSDLENFWNSRKEFDRLQSLPVMHDVATALKTYTPTPQTLPPDFLEKHPEQGKAGQYTDPVVGYLRSLKAPDSVKADVWDAYYQSTNEDEIAARLKKLPLDNNSRARLWEMKHANPAPPPVIIPSDPPVPKASPGEGASGWVPVFEARKADVIDKIADPAAEITVDVNNQDGIATVNADRGGAISSIELTTGEWVRKGPNTFKAHLSFIARLLLPFCYPVVGFLILWGSVRVLNWVGTGFFEAKA